MTFEVVETDEGKILELNAKDQDGAVLPLAGYKVFLWVAGAGAVEFTVTDAPAGKAEYTTEAGTWKPGVYDCEFELDEDAGDASLRSDRHVLVVQPAIA